MTCLNVDDKCFFLMVCINCARKMGTKIGITHFQAFHITLKSREMLTLPVLIFHDLLKIAHNCRIFALGRIKVIRNFLTQRGLQKLMSFPDVLLIPSVIHSLHTKPAPHKFRLVFSQHTK